jgi:hypothetical protein
MIKSNLENNPGLNSSNQSTNVGYDLESVSYTSYRSDRKEKT